MKVIVNGLAALKQKSGVGHYTAELLRCFRAQATGDQIDVFPSGWLRLASSVLVGTGQREARSAAANGEAPRPRLLSRLRSQAIQSLRTGFQTVRGWRFGDLCRREKYDLYHEPNFLPLPCETPTITTLHDLSVLLHPEWHPANRIALYEKQFSQLVKRCAHFIAVSDFTSREVLRTLGVPPERVTRIYNGIRPGLRPLPPSETACLLRRLGLPPQYLLCVGTLEPRKNLLMLLRAYCALPATLRERWPLLLVGGWGWNAKAVADYMDAVAQARGVRHLGYLPDEHLGAVYNGARALCYPSHYEGFGLPPLEMLACGGAVIGSTADALVETVGGQAHLVHPDDLDGWRDALTHVLVDDDWWHALRNGAATKARPFTWERCAAETLRLFHSLCDRAAKQKRVAGERRVA